MMICNVLAVSGVTVIAQLCFSVSSAVDASNKHCAVNNIPVQQGFQLPEVSKAIHQL